MKLILGEIDKVPYIQQNQMIQDGKMALLSILKELPGLRVLSSADEPAAGTYYGVDFSVEVGIKGKKWTLLVETKGSGEPKLVRESVYALSGFAQKNDRACLIFAAPYLSDETQGICRQAGISFFDLAGNCRIIFDTVLIERTGQSNRLVERRPLKSLFSLKSSRIVRKMLMNPRKTWQVQELAKETNTSIGLVSRLKQTMTEMDFLPADDTLRFPDPERVLASWSKVYSYKDNEILEVFAPGTIVEANETALVTYCRNNNIACGLTMFSSANRIEQFVQGISKGFAYADTDLTDLSKALGWTKVPTGANFLLLRPKDAGYFYDEQEIEGLPLVSNIQTYLDLNGYKGRGEEAAEALLERRIKPAW